MQSSSRLGRALAKQDLGQPGQDQRQDDRHWGNRDGHGEQRGTKASCVGTVNPEAT